jgi:hypothetical protein
MKQIIQQQQDTIHKPLSLYAKSPVIIINIKWITKFIIFGFISLPPSNNLLDYN